MCGWLVDFDEMTWIIIMPSTIVTSGLLIIALAAVQQYVGRHVYASLLGYWLHARRAFRSLQLRRMDEIFLSRGKFLPKFLHMNVNLANYEQICKYHIM